MKVKEFIEKLSKFNSEADIDIVVNNSTHDFEICYGNSEGCTKENCDEVSLYVKGLNTFERIPTDTMTLDYAVTYTMDNVPKNSTAAEIDALIAKLHPSAHEFMWQEHDGSSLLFDED